MVDRLKINNAEERHQLRKRIAELKAENDYSRGWNDALFRVSQIARRALTGGQEDG